VQTLEQVQALSVKRLEGLNPIVKRAVLELISRAFAASIPIIIVQGLRTIEYQNELYAQGRTKPGQIVTNAKGGYSYHNFGLAVDFALLMPDSRTLSWDTNRDGDNDGQHDWMEVVNIAKSLGFEWGGDWASFVDMPHLQISFGLSTAQLRAGAKPPTTIPIEEDQPMTQAEQLAFDTLAKKVEAQSVELVALTQQVNSLSVAIPAPNWFVQEFGAGVVAKMSNPTGSLEFWRAIAVTLRVQGIGNGN
jgi:peptidoglycan LD-endopeptidase CwlK